MGTIILWGGDSTLQELMVSCTIGKYLGSSFGRGLCTRRSTRCHGECLQCDAVYMEGIDFGNVPSTLRWAVFPEFPEVDWQNSEYSEFDLAASLASRFSLPQPSRDPCNTRKACATKAEDADVHQCTACFGAADQLLSPRYLLV